MVSVPTVELYCADCLDKLPELADESVDAVITDPPYGVQAAGWDSEIPPQFVLDECLRISRGPVIWFGAAPIRCIAPTMKYSPLPDRVLVWHLPFTLSKTGANGMYYRWHPIWCWRLPKKQREKVFWKDVIDCNQEGHHWWNHPGTKPLKLMNQLVLAWGGQSVLDPFMGSGTTGVACVQNGCDFIGIERLDEPGYFPTAQERIAEALTESRQVEMTL